MPNLTPYSLDNVSLLINLLLGIVLYFVSRYISAQTASIKANTDAISHKTDRHDTRSLELEIKTQVAVRDAKIEDLTRQHGEDLLRLSDRISQYKEDSYSRVDNLRDKEVTELFKMQREYQDGVHKDINSLAQNLRLEIKESAKQTSAEMGAHLDTVVSAVQAAMTSKPS